MEDPQLQAILEQFTPEYQAIVTGPEPSLLAQSFAETFELSNKEQTVLENSFRLYLMGIHSTTEWVVFVADFTSLDQQTAKIVVDEMETHVADDIKLQIEEFRTGTNVDSGEVTPDKSSVQDIHDTPKLNQEATQTPTTGLSTIRTMQSDASARQGTTTTDQQKPAVPSADTSTQKTPNQDESQQEHAPQTPPPPGNTPPGPRWASEQTQSE